MIRIFLILLGIYLIWIIYRIFTNNRNRQSKIRINPLLIFLLLFLILLGGYFILPKVVFIIQKFIPLLSSPMQLFQVILQKFLPIINSIRGILPF